MKGVVQLIVLFFRFLPRVVYIVRSSETLVQTDHIVRYKIPNACHHQYKSYYFRYNVKKAEPLILFPSTVYN